MIGGPGGGKRMAEEQKGFEGQVQEGLLKLLCLAKRVSFGMNEGD